MEMNIPKLEHNQLPSNFKEITSEQFGNSMFFVYSSTREDWQRIDGITYKIFWFYDGRCFAISEERGKLRFWEGCLCEHEYKITNLGRCWNRYDCQKCGFSKEVDSSD